MKILWISPTPSHPQNAGNRAHICALAKRVLADGHDVTFMFYGQENVTPENIEEMRQFWPTFVHVPHRIRQRTRSQSSVWGIDDWYNVDIESAVKYLQTQCSFDVAICEYVFLSKALTLFPANVFKVLNCHDRMSGRADLLRSQGIEPDFFYTNEAQEKIALDRADLVLAIQHDEREFFQNLTRKPVMELGFAVEARSTSLNKRSERLRIGYIGSNNSLNRKSINSFLVAWSSHPYLMDNSTVVLAGSICGNTGDFGATELGIVEDEGDFYSAIDIAINPMVDGTGLKIKSLSALQYDTPLLATSAATLGLPTNEANHTCHGIDDLIERLEIIVSGEEQALDRLRIAGRQVLTEYLYRHDSQTRDFLRALSTRSARHLRRKRVLIVTDVPFWEAGAGSHSRILEICRQVMRHADLSVFFYGSMWPAREERLELAGLRGIVISYKVFEKEAGTMTGASTFPKPSGLQKWRHEVFFRTLQAFVRTRPQFDAIIFEYIWLAYLSDAVKYPCVRILDTHDLMSYRECRFLMRGSRAGVSISFAEELDLLDRFDFVAAIQREEADILSASLSRAIALNCPHGVQIPDNVEVTKYPSKLLTFGFIGALNEANSAALVWFVSNVWTVVCGLDVRLRVYGDVSKTARIVAPGIDLVGHVPDINAAYDECEVMINPVIHGGGLKIKSVEALAYGKPLIASPEAVVGIDLQDDAGIILARNRSDFIDAILYFYNNRESLKQYSSNARRTAARQFDPAACLAPLTALIADL